MESNERLLALSVQRLRRCPPRVSHRQCWPRPMRRGPVVRYDEPLPSWISLERPDSPASSRRPGPEELAQRVRRIANSGGKSETTVAAHLRRGHHRRWAHYWIGVARSFALRGYPSMDKAPLLQSKPSNGALPIALAALRLSLVGAELGAFAEEATRVGELVDEVDETLGNTRNSGEEGAEIE